MPAAKILAFPVSPPKPEKRPVGRRSSSSPALVKTRPTVTIDADFPGEAALTAMRKLHVPPLEKITKPFFD